MKAALLSETRRTVELCDCFRPVMLFESVLGAVYKTGKRRVDDESALDVVSRLCGDVYEYIDGTGREDLTGRCLWS